MATAVAQAKVIRGYRKAHPSTRLVPTVVGGGAAVLLAWQFDGKYVFGSHGGIAHRVRLSGRSYLFVHRGRLYDFDYLTTLDRLATDGRVFTASIRSLKFTS
jgi:hypothetical protein